MELIFKEEVYEIIGAAIEVHREMGPGFLEPVYQECLEYELTDRRVPFKPQAGLRIRSKKRALKKKYAPDFIVYDKITQGSVSVDQLSQSNRFAGRGAHQLQKSWQARMEAHGAVVSLREGHAAFSSGWR